MRAEEKSSFSLPNTVYFGFDLLRLPGGLLRRWWLPLPLGAVGLALGLLAGTSIFEVYTTVTARLMSRNPDTFATSRTSYTPPRIQEATLLQSLGSPEVARRVVKRLSWPVSVAELMEMVYVQDVRRTDFVNITVHGRLSPTRAVELASVWAEEAVAFTSSLQSEESGNLRVHLEEQLRIKDRELVALNQQTTRLREEAGVIDAAREIDEYLRALQGFNVEFESNRVELEALEFQLQSLRSEIRKHSPLFEELKTAEARLAELAEYYTEQNPIYLDALDRVTVLRRQAEREASADDIDFAQFTGTFVGNAIYLQILDVQNRLNSLNLRQEKVITMREAARERLAHLPEIALQAGRLLESVQMLQAARDALAGRLQEVIGFEEMAPGYYRIFRLPTREEAYVGTRKKKVVFLGMVGGLAFFGAGLFGGAVMEFADQRLRTKREAADIFSTSCIAYVSPSRQKSAREDANLTIGLWADMIRPLAKKRLRAFWIPQEHPSEKDLWLRLESAAQSLGLRALILYEEGPALEGLSELPLWNGKDDVPDSSICRHALPSGGLNFPLADEGRWRRTFQEIWVVYAGSLREPMAETLRAAPDLFVVCSLGYSRKSFWELQASLLHRPKNLRGIIALDT